MLQGTPHILYITFSVKAFLQISNLKIQGSISTQGVER